MERVVVEGVTVKDPRQIQFSHEKVACLINQPFIHARVAVMLKNLSTCWP